MTANIGEFVTKTTAQIRDDILRTIQNAYLANGMTSQQVSSATGPGTDDFIWATAIANELTPLYVNSQIKADSMMPDTATGDVATGQTVGSDLQRLMAIVGLAPRPASSSAGFITLGSSATTTIPSGAQLVDAAGLRFQVASSGVFANGSIIPVVSVDTGAATNHGANDILTWVTPPPFCNPKQLCGVPGQVTGAPALTGGADAENNDTARARLLTRLQNPPGSGNWSQVNAFAEASTPIVQKSFCYPAVNGPSTAHVAVVANPSSSNKNRDVASIVMTATVNPYVLGQMPEYVETIVTTVTNVPTDISMGLTLPSAPTAQPAGPGGGWLDGTPWPAISGIQTYANVTSVSPGGATFVVNAPTAPTDGVSHISFLDPTNWTLYSATVLSHSGSAGAYTITIDQPFPNLAAALALGGTGPMIWPTATNGQTYVNTLLAALALMGPGEKTSNVGVLARGYRHPLPTNSWPYSLNATVLKQVENAGSEVLDTNYYLRSTVTPGVPVAVALPPQIIVPRHIGFYPI